MLSTHLRQYRNRSLTLQRRQLCLSLRFWPPRHNWQLLFESSDFRARFFIEASIKHRLQPLLELFSKIFIISWRADAMNSAAIPDKKHMTDLSDAEDETLLRLFCAGSEDAAARLFERYGGRLYDVAERQLGNDLLQRVDADDIVQSVFRTFFRRAINGEYQVPKGEELWRLLLVIGLNKVRSQGVRHRAQRRDVSRTANCSDSTKPAQDQTGFVVLKMAIDDLVSSFPEAHRHIVNLRIEGFEIGEIANKTKRSHRTVERVLQQFRNHLQEVIHPEHDDTQV